MVRINAGIQVNARTDEGETPLSLAQLTEHEEIVQIMKAAGARE